MQTITVLCEFHPEPLLKLSEHSKAVDHPSLLAHIPITIDVDAPESVKLTTAVDLLLPADVDFDHAHHTPDDGSVTVTHKHTLPTHSPESRGLPIGPVGHIHPAADVTVTASDGKNYPVHVFAQLHPMAGKHADGTTGTAIKVEIE